MYEGVDNKDGTYTFSGIKSFSPFALMSVELSSNTNDNSNLPTTNPNQPTTNNNPNTRDYTNVLIFILLSSFASLVLMSRKIFNK